MAESDEHFQNANLSIRESLEPDSNMTIDRDSHPVKQLSSIVSTGDGIQIADSDAQWENANSPMEESLEPDSNVTVESDSHPMKQLS
jgi:hypothetical protein